MIRVNYILNNAKYKYYLNILTDYEKDRFFCRHNMNHFLSVARIMTIKSIDDNMDIKRDIIYAIALLHDIGRSLQYKENIDHAIASSDLAKIILKECSYSKKEIIIITDAIAKHNDISDDSYINNLLKYADKISRNCFDCAAFKNCNWSENKKNKGVIL